MSAFLKKKAENWVHLTGQKFPSDMTFVIVQAFVQGYFAVD